MAINDIHTDHNQLQSIFRCVLSPRSNRDLYEPLMRPILAVMCFTEGCVARTKSPFLNSDGSPVASLGEGMIPRLSTQGMKALNKKSLSDFMLPPEEVFVCLTLAKCIAWKMKNDGHALTEFCTPNTNALPVSPWKGKKTDAYEQDDIDFFYSHITVVNEVYKEDRQKPVSQRWMYFDFTTELPNNANPSAASTTDGEAAQATAANVTVTVDAAPIFTYEK